MNRTRWTTDDLARALDGLRDAEAQVETSHRVEAALLQAWDAAHASDRAPAPSGPLCGSECKCCARRVDPTAVPAAARSAAPQTLATSQGAPREYQGRSPLAGWLRTAAAVAAAFAVATMLGVLGRQLHRGNTMPPPDAGRTLVVVGGPILAGEPVRVVRMRMPRSALTAIGLRSAQSEIAALVEVDVIVGEDGVARAIRVGM